MNIKSIRALLLAIAILLGGIVLYYGIVFDGQLPDYRWLRGKNDLALHALAFFALSLPVLALWPRLSSVICMAGLAGAVEIAQFWMPRRNPGLDDILASLAGIVLGALLLWALNRIWHRVKAARAGEDRVLQVEQTMPDKKGEDAYPANR